MKRYAILALLLLSAPASALLYCYNGDTSPPTQMEWANGKFTFYDPAEQPLHNPGPTLTQEPFTQFFCYANGSELAYIAQNLPDLRVRAPKANAIGPTKGYGTVFWTGDEARWLWNNL